MVNGLLIYDSERRRPYFNSMKCIFSYLNISEIRCVFQQMVSYKDQGNFFALFLVVVNNDTSSNLQHLGFFPYLSIKRRKGRDREIGGFRPSA